MKSSDLGLRGNRCLCRTCGERFNSAAGNDLIILKVGVHAGACLAVTLNDRLDYFGQTVNIAARVQGVAGANEIVVTDDDELQITLDNGDEVIATKDPVSTLPEQLQALGLTGPQRAAWVNVSSTAPSP